MSSLFLFGAVSLLALRCVAHAHAAERQCPLCDYEVNSLNEDTLFALLQTKADESTSQLFRFSDGSPPDPNRFKSGAYKVFPGDAARPAQKYMGLL